MPQPQHPDDELLAALAGDEPEAASDSALKAHVAECDRCGPMVQDLRQLRSALAGLPDVAPSRPLQLLPPVRDTAPMRGGFVGFLRGLTGPAMAVGVLLIVVGALGTTMSGMGLGGAGAAAASAGFLSEADGSKANQPVAGVASSSVARGQGTAAPHDAYSSGRPTVAPPAIDDGGRLNSTSTPAEPWAPMLAIGIGLLAAAFLVRAALKRPEAEPNL
jgi:hypothetical protein